MLPISLFHLSFQTDASNPDSTAPPSFQDLEQTKLGRIVFISQLKHCRKTVGSLKAYDTSSKQVLFSPRDSRIPRLLIPLDQCPADYIADKRKYDTSIFAAQITEWAVRCDICLFKVLNTVVKLVFCARLILHTLTAICWTV